MPSRINIGPENGPYVAINESSGNLQLEDNSGNVVAEWDETNAQWDFVENDISGVGAFDSESVNTESASVNGPLDAETATIESLATPQGSIWDQTNNDPLQNTVGLTTVESTSTVSSTSFTGVGKIAGGVDGGSVPNGATLYAKQVFRSGFGNIDQDVTVRPRVFTAGGNAVDLSELNTTVAAGDTGGPHSSGWTEITTGSVASDWFVGITTRAALDTQTNGDSADPIDDTRYSVLFEWRLD